MVFHNDEREDNKIEHARCSGVDLECHLTRLSGKKINIDCVGPTSPNNDGVLDSIYQLSMRRAVREVRPIEV